VGSFFGAKAFVPQGLYCRNAVYSIVELLKRPIFLVDQQGFFEKNGFCSKKMMFFSQKSSFVRSTFNDFEL
jgi:hypothetical protein